MDFRNTIVVMTSNIGSDLIRRDSHMGFSPKGANEEQTSKAGYTTV